MLQLRAVLTNFPCRKDLVSGVWPSSMLIDIKNSFGQPLEVTQFARDIFIRCGIVKLEVKWVFILSS